jgi:glycosyltransferase involved in cell wall biosynthesis
MGYPVPPTPLMSIEAPVAYLVADWSWPPNKVAISWLLKAWPAVRDVVPGACLLLAGHLANHESIGPIKGVKFLGKVNSSAEVLSMASVLAFPCPASSGPKVKVLEAMAHGLPVVTTPSGVEGLVVQDGEGALVVHPKHFAKGLTELLLSPERRADLGRSGRAAVQANHSPLASARARLSAFAETFGS